jgi:hypothetical protein
MAGGGYETEQKAGNEADGYAKRKRHTHTPLLVMLHRSLLHKPHQALHIVIRPQPIFGGHREECCKP